jgi:hypothetical protein
MPARPGKLAADNHTLKLLVLQIKVLHTTGNFVRRKPTRELHVVFIVQYLCDFNAQFSRQQAVIKYHTNANVRSVS